MLCTRQLRYYNKYNMRNSIHYEVIIIGGSYAGLAAGMALGRALRKVLIIDSGEPCNRQTPYSHNFLTQDGQPPARIAGLARDQVLAYNTVTLLNGMAVAVRPAAAGFEVDVQGAETFTGRKLLFATGIRDQLPDIPGIHACWGISVLHCPYCHGYEVRGRVTGILANGDNAFELAMLIAHWTSSLTVYTQGGSSLTASQMRQLEKHRIPVVEKEIARLEAEKGYLQHLVFTDGSFDSLDAIYARPPFVQQSSLPEALGCALTPEGYIQLDTALRTTVPGIYAAGDNASRMRTVAHAVSMGTAAGIMINKDMLEEDF